MQSRHPKPAPKQLATVAHGKGTSTVSVTGGMKYGSQPMAKTPVAMTAVKSMAKFPKMGKKTC